MIISFFLLIITSFFSFVFAPLPTVTELPWGVDNFLVSGIGYFRLIMEFFPPFSTVLSAFLIYMGYLIGKIVLRFFLGSRTPTHV